MKLFLALANGIVIMVLIGFNYYAFKRISNIAEMISAVSQQLDVRGRRRYETQKYYTDWLVSEGSNNQGDVSLDVNDLFAPLGAVPLNIPLLDDWSYRAELESRRLALEQVKSAYLNIIINRQNFAEDMVLLKHWSDKMLDMLDQIQSLNVDLSSYLSMQMNYSLKKIVLVNSVALVCVFSLTFMVVYHNQRVNLNKSQVANRRLEAQKKTS